MIEIITGSLLDATEKYIVHQTNCISTGSAAGIAKAIFDKYPYADCYADRKEPAKPGTIDIRGNGIDKRYVINLCGQNYPGKIVYPKSSTDGVAAREKYFYHGLLRIAKISELESIAINWRIGCGIAGGDWGHYFQMLVNMEKYLNEKYGTIVRIYRLAGEE